jgi:3-hydroxyacyl-CoA dehydrogenase
LPVPQYQLTGSVAVIALEHPPLNTLSLPLRAALFEALLEARQDPAVQAIVLKGDGRGFSAGGDVTEFDGPAIHQEPQLNPLFALIEDGPKPVIAAVHGMAIGGGLELAMACHARVAALDAQVGLPEVTLGMLPGAGGTQRLPRLVGLELAFNLITQGKVQPARKLRDSGLFNLLVDGDPLPEAIELAADLARRIQAGEKLPRTCDLPVQMENAQAFLAYGRATVKSRSRDLPAPAACVDCLEYAATLPFREGLAREHEAVSRLVATPQFAGLRHAFLAERRAAQPPESISGVRARPVGKAAVVGAGTMGAGISMCLANAGIPVVLVERAREPLDRALLGIAQNYEASVKKGQLSAEQATQRIALVRGAVDLAEAADAELFIEAIFEDMEAKRSVFQRLDAVARPGAVLATNTSMLDVDEIARCTRRPQDVLGLHFFSPAHIMKLLEVVRAAATAPDVLATGLELAKRLGKTVVVSGVCEGFIGNRMLQPYLIQAGFLLDEGALPEQVDRAMEAWGMAMGPFRMCDMAGNDLGGHIRDQRLAKNPGLVYSGTAAAIEKLGRLGTKVSKGWYDYIPGERSPKPSAEVRAAILAESARLGLERRAIGDGEIVERLVLSLANEGARLLEEGIAARASDIDVAYLAGYGFPRWRGGPLFYAERRGLKHVLATMRRLETAPGYQKPAEFWRPATLLAQAASSGKSLYPKD